MERRPQQHWPPGPSLPPQCPHPRHMPLDPMGPVLLPPGTGPYSQVAQKQRWTRGIFLQTTSALLKNLPRFSHYELKPRLLSREPRPLQPALECLPPFPDTPPPRPVASVGRTFTPSHFTTLGSVPCGKALLSPTRMSPSRQGQRLPEHPHP